MLTLDRHPVIAKDKDMKIVLEIADKMARSNNTILLEGESGVGKEVMAHFIHQKSDRNPGPFIPVNCGGIPESLFESEFFGHTRGAFTNAYSAHRGYFEQANGGTLFLDEIAELPLNIQVKFLRILEDRKIFSIGDEKSISVDVRVIAASNRNLLSLVHQKLFRNDLFYRIAVFRIWIPPLRKRKDDIIPLIEHVLKKNNIDGKTLSDRAIKKLLEYKWPGNVRELETCINRALLYSQNVKTIDEDDIIFDDNIGFNHSFDKSKILEALEVSQGGITAAARILGIHRNTIYNKIRKYRIDLGLFRVENGDNKN